MKVFLLLDVGGTGIKSGVMDCSGRLLDDEMYQCDANACADCDTVLNTFCTVLCDLLDKTAVGSEVEAIGMAFPGPFDFDSGISLMQGLGKYESIYGVPLVDALHKRLPKQLQATPIFFLHDVEAFARGVISHRQVAEGQRILHLCLGTGTGSAFTSGRQVLRSGQGVPPNGWLYNKPFHNSIIDDYLSARGLAKLAKKQLGKPMDGLLLYELAGQGDSTALSVFGAFGELLVEAITPFLNDFAPHQLVLGGQVSGSLCYFGTKLQALCDSREIPIILQSQPSQMILLGLLDRYKQLHEG